MEQLPAKLTTLDHERLRQAGKSRDERMSILFRRWPALNAIELSELRKLNDERLRIARHLGIRRRLHALRAPQSSLEASASDGPEWERDREAWNLPLRPATADPH
jgi:hypothetical protein